jgi:hypothetical protein
MAERVSAWDRCRALRPYDVFLKCYTDALDRGEFAMSAEDGLRLEAIMAQGPPMWVQALRERIERDNDA